MKLILYFRGPCTFLNERLDFFQLTLVSSLKSRSIMENKLWIVGKGEWAVNIVDPTLIRVGLNILVQSAKTR